jgi:nucleoside-diphosphate-sugar epimerase
MADEQAEVWILGATGRIGRALAPRIAAQTELVPVLAGRDPARLAEASVGLNGAARTIVAASPSAIRPVMQAQQRTPTGSRPRRRAAVPPARAAQVMAMRLRVW